MMIKLDVAALRISVKAVYEGTTLAGPGKQPSLIQALAAEDGSQGLEESV